MDHNGTLDRTGISDASMDDLGFVWVVWIREESLSLKEIKVCKKSICVCMVSERPHLRTATSMLISDDWGTIYIQTNDSFGLSPKKVRKFH